jgi:hypothetical protein
LNIVNVDLKSIEFTSDHESGGSNILNDNNSDWTDSGTAYTEPEWVDGGDNNPISHTKNTKLTAKVKIKVEPSGISFDLKGDGPNGYVDFNKAGLTSTGADQEITVTADDNLPDQVDTLTKSIDWSIDVSGTECDAGSSGGHKIYVTYGTPAGSVVTECRVRWCCTTCDGESTEQGIADKIYTALASDPPKFKLKSPNLPSPLWLLMSSVTYQGQCIDLAKLMKLELEMLGASGAIGYVYGSTDTTCFSTSASAYESRTCPGGSHGNEVIRVWSAGGWNNWEAVCKVGATCYAVKLDKGTAIEILRNWLGSNTTSGNYQAWRYWDAGSSSWQVCTTPGPCPAHKP